MNKSEIFIYKARQAKRKKNYKMALKIYDDAIRSNPENAKAYYERGNIKAIIGDIKGAIGDYDLSIKLNSNNAESYINRGILKQREGDIKGAERDFQLAKSLGDIRAFNVKLDLIL